MRTTYLAKVYSHICNQSKLLRRNLNSFHSAAALQDCPLVLDQAIYRKAQHIIWEHPTQFERVVPCLGAFHTACTYLAVLGKRYGDAGLADILVESGVLGSGSIAGVLEGKHYNRAVRMHKLVAEALERLRW